MAQSEKSGTGPTPEEVDQLLYGSDGDMDELPDDPLTEVLRTGLKGDRCVGKLSEGGGAVCAGILCTG